MAYKKPKKDITPLTPTENYWQDFLKSKNLMPQYIFGAQKQSQSQVRQPEVHEFINPDILQFIYRVAERLTPFDGLDPEAKKRCLAIRDTHRRQLIEVFEGRADFQQWFIEARRSSNMRDIDFMQMLYECLEGLSAPEAKQLQQEYLAALKKMSGL